MTYRLTTGTFSNDPQQYFLKWGDDRLGVESGEITFSMNLDDLRFDRQYSRTQFELAVQAAFSAWQAVTNLSFRMVDYDPNNLADIVIETADSSEVGSLAGSTVGLARYSYSSGNDRNNDVAEIGSATVYMDTDPEWTPGDEGGFNTVNFYAVVLHEIGHALGLDHVDDDTEIMNDVVAATDLGDGDIAGIQVLYGDVPDTPSNPTNGNDTISYAGTNSSQLINAQDGDDIVGGSEAADIIRGGLGNDQITGNGGSDLIIDTRGTNALSGNGGNDVIVGGRGTLVGSGGDDDDVIFGGFGDDMLNGGRGNDTLRGDPAGSLFVGDDQLTAGRGTDYLEGGGGADTFIFNRFDGTNYIAELDIDADSPGATRTTGADFEGGIDLVDLSEFNYSNGDDVFDNIDDTAGYAVFSDQGTSIHFVGLQINELSESDFIL